MEYNKGLSKFLSLVLRHKPETIDIELDENGWVSVNELLNKINNAMAFGSLIDHEDLDKVVIENDKQRFSFNEDKSKIRASQGHSVKVDLKLKEEIPPVHLYHGTVEKYIDEIMSSGLTKMKRHHVHLSKDVETATAVGNRRGKCLMLEINALEMHSVGYKFYLSDNGVWLTDIVPSKYINKI